MQPSVTARFPPIETVHSSRTIRSLFLAISILSAAGLVLSAVSLQRHYAKSATSYCDFGQQFNCDIVNRSEYSSIIGIPVAAIGVAGYGALIALSVRYRAQSRTALRLLIASTLGLAFALYLTYIEAYVLTTWCVLCLISLGLISLITVLAALSTKASKRQ
ncbi:MAG TPA: vitamin K epoxide reductase family protein [Candidatus Sulfotelmatobacter sp.]